MFSDLNTHRNNMNKSDNNNNNNNDNNNNILNGYLCVEHNNNNNNINGYLCVEHNNSNNSYTQLSMILLTMEMMDLLKIGTPATWSCGICWQAVKSKIGQRDAKSPQILRGGTRSQRTTTAEEQSDEDRWWSQALDKIAVATTTATADTTTTTTVTANTTTVNFTTLMTMAEEEEEEEEEDFLFEVETINKMEEDKAIEQHTRESVGCNSSSSRHLSINGGVFALLTAVTVMLAGAINNICMK